MKNSEKDVASVKEAFIKIRKPMEDDGKTAVSSASSIENRYVAVVNIFSQVFDYFKSNRLLPCDIISDIRFIVDEYIETQLNNNFKDKEQFDDLLFDDEEYY